MAGTGGRLGRIAAMAAALAVGLLLVAAHAAAGAGFYTVVQCGAGVGADADAAWIDGSGANKFRPDAFCAATGGAGLSSAHVGSITVDDGIGVTSTQSAIWRWAAPGGTGIVEVSGNWWHALNDGFNEWLGTDPGNGVPSPFLQAAKTELAPTPFSVSFQAPRAGFEDQLVCARPLGFTCSLSSPSWSALSALSLRLQDFAVPGAALAGDLLGGGWRRGVENATVSGADVGSGLRFGEVRIDGQPVAQAKFPCSEAAVGIVVATRMRPCQAEASASLAVATTKLTDGSHAASACVADFAENLACTADQAILIDNGAPAPALGLEVAAAGRGGTGEFDVAWTDPDQGPGSPVGAAFWQVTGPDGYETGTRVDRGRGIATLEGVKVPRPGDYTLHLWLGDEAGNSSPASAVAVSLRDGARAGGPTPVGGGPKGPGGGPKPGRGDGPAEAGARVRLKVHLRSGGPGISGRGRRASGRGGTLSVRFGSGASVAGRLTDAGGTGIAGRRIHVVARPWRGAGAAITRATVRTGSRGGFDLSLAPGPSRRVAVTFAGGAGLAPARREGLDLRVRSGVTLRAAPATLETGQEVHLSGRVGRGGASIPGPGKLVAIQYLETATHRWRPALVVRSDRRGRFETSYRFRYVSGTARIRLRATALAEAGWPYAPGSSPPVTVAVRGR